MPIECLDHLNTFLDVHYPEYQRCLLKVTPETIKFVLKGYTCFYHFEIPNEDELLNSYHAMAITTNRKYCVKTEGRRFLTTCNLGITLEEAEDRLVQIGDMYFNYRNRTDLWEEVTFIIGLAKEAIEDGFDDIEWSELSNVTTPCQTE